MHTIIKS